VGFQEVCHYVPRLSFRCTLCFLSHTSARRTTLCGELFCISAGQVMLSRYTNRVLTTSKKYIDLSSSGLLPPPDLSQILGLTGSSPPSALSLRDECTGMPITVLRLCDRSFEQSVKQSQFVSMTATGEALDTRNQHSLDWLDDHKAVDILQDHAISASVSDRSFGSLVEASEL
jgi:hypothetical protein